MYSKNFSPPAAANFQILPQINIFAAACGGILTQRKCIFHRYCFLIHTIIIHDTKQHEFHLLKTLSDHLYTYRVFFTHGAHGVGIRWVNSGLADEHADVSITDFRDRHLMIFMFQILLLFVLWALERFKKTVNLISSRFCHFLVSKTI